MGKTIMFMLFMWMGVCLAGNVWQGQMEFVRTGLTADLTAAGTTINVRSTAGFPVPGIVVIENERIAYSDTTATTIVGTLVQPMVRGAEGTEAVAHLSGKAVSTVPGAMVNSSAAYNMAVMADPSGMLVFISLPLAFFSLLGSFFFLPLEFLGTDLQILTYLWAVIGIGVLSAIAFAVVGGRRV